MSSHVPGLNQVLSQCYPMCQLAPVKYQGNIPVVFPCLVGIY